MRILISGAGGVIGSAVLPYLEAQGHAVVRLVRREPGDGEIRWDPDAGTIDAGRLEGFDGVVHMASLPQAKWTREFEQQMRENRLTTNRLLAETLAAREEKPRVLICCSGQGFYASSGDQLLCEDCPAGTDFIAELQRDGEAATQPAQNAGIRVIHLRIPTVLGGPNLKLMASNIHRLGSGQQWWSWVARDEMPSIVEHALTTASIAGPVNTASPNPVRNVEFNAIIGRILGRKPGLPVPAFLARLALGDIADALLLASRRLEPKKLLATGYQFRFPQLEPALRHELGRAA